MCVYIYIYVIQRESICTGKVIYLWCSCSRRVYFFIWGLTNRPCGPLGIHIYIYIYRERERDNIHFFFLLLTQGVRLSESQAFLSGAPEAEDSPRVFELSLSIYIYNYIVYIYIYIYIHRERERERESIYTDKVRYLWRACSRRVYLLPGV